MGLLNKNDNINTIKKFVQENASNKVKYDYNHAIRVLRYAKDLVKDKDLNANIVYTAALLHCLIDHKFFGNTDVINNKISHLLVDNGYSSEDIEHIIFIINNMDAVNENKITTPEGLVVRDADRLDSILAIGVPHVFVTGVEIEKDVYGSDESSLSYYIKKTINMEKLLVTDTAKEYAKGKSDIIYIFLAYLLNQLPDDIYEKVHYKEEIKQFYKEHADIIPSHLMK